MSDERSGGARRLSDPREMRAVAHPVRLALLEALLREGPLTATEASEILGESPANCSFHLRTLAKYGFVEEAEGGKGRQRPWRRVNQSTSFTEEQDSPEAAHAAHALAGLFHERIFERVRTFQETRHTFPQPWRETAFADQAIAYLTSDELAQLEADLLALLRRHQDRTVDPSTRPADALPVALSAFGHPLPPLRPSP